MKPREKYNFKNFTKDTSIATSTMMIKGDLARKYKFTETKICEDYFYKCSILKEIGFAYCLDKNSTLYRIRKNSLQSNKFRNLYWIWKINKHFFYLTFWFPSIRINVEDFNKTILLKIGYHNFSIEINVKYNNNI